MVEWFKASVLKTDEGQPSGGSNPPLSAIFLLKTGSSGIAPREYAGKRFLNPSFFSCLRQDMFSCPDECAPGNIEDRRTPYRQKAARPVGAGRQF